jgi:hypothetical protein
MAPAWRRSSQSGGAAVGEAPAWRRSMWRRGARGGGAVDVAPTWRRSGRVEADAKEERALTGVWQGNDSNQDYGLGALHT